MNESTVYFSYLLVLQSKMSIAERSDFVPAEYTFLITLHNIYCILVGVVALFIFGRYSSVSVDFKVV